MYIVTQAPPTKIASIPSFLISSESNPARFFKEMVAQSITAGSPGVEVLYV